MSYDMPIAVVPEFRVLYEDDGVLVVEAPEKSGRRNGLGNSAKPI